MRVTRTIDVSREEIESAKKNAIMLVGAVEPFDLKNLENCESQIKRLNAFTASSWLLSAMLLYCFIFNEELYMQSGLDWFHYSKESRERLGIGSRNVSELLAAARFFIRNHKKLISKGFMSEKNFRKLARAELAEALCNDTDLVIEHIVNDTWQQFNAWYREIKLESKLNSNKKQHKIQIRHNTKRKRFFIGDVEAVQISAELDKVHRKILESCLSEIFENLEKGKIPHLIYKNKKKRR